MLAQFGERASLLAGGTDLVILMRHGRVRPDHVVSLGSISGLDRLTADGGLTIGALATHHSIEGWRAIARPSTLALFEGVHAIGGPQVRNVATIGGNLCNASPAADTAPPLLCFDAQVRLASLEASRLVPLEELFTGPGRTVRTPSEVVTEIVIPPPPPDSASAFLKAGRRRAMELAMVSVAVQITFEQDGMTCKTARIALGSVAPTPIRAREAEALLCGKQIGPAVAREVGRRAGAAARPISDVRASAEYRRTLIEIMTERAIDRCVERIRPRSEEQ